MQLDGYIRVSRVNGREGDSFISPEVQREQIERWAQLRGVKIAAWHTDLDQSGGKLARPGLDKAMARIRTGKTGGLAVARLDRFSRAGVADALKVVEEIHGHGAKIAAVDLGIDPTTPFGEFAMTLMLGLARMQRRQIADTWRESQRRAVERGVHIASKAPTGFVRDQDGRLEPHPEYGQHIVEVFRRKAAGVSWSDLAHYLREHNVQSPYGTTNWQPRSLSHMIGNRAYLGEARSGEFTNPSAHKALVDESTWQAAQEAAGERPVNRMGGSLLAGVLRCEGCGYVLKPDSMKDRDGSKLRLYRCRTERSTGRCPSPASVLGNVIEPHVVGTFFDGLKGMRAEGVAMADDLRAAEETVKRAEREMTTYLAAVSAADIGAEAFAAGARQRRESVEEAHATFEEARVRAGLADLPLTADLEAEWPDLDVPDRNRLLRAGFDAVVLSRGRVPIGERARVYWRGEAPPEAMCGRGK